MFFFSPSTRSKEVNQKSNGIGSKLQDDEHSQVRKPRPAPQINTCQTLEADWKSRMTVVSDVKCSVVLGLREERSPECCLLFAVAPSISLTLPPPTHPPPADQPSQVGLGYLWKHEVCPCGVKGISAAPCWFYRGILWNDMDFYCCHRSKHVSFHQLLPGS